MHINIGTHISLASSKADTLSAAGEREGRYNGKAIRASLDSSGSSDPLDCSRELEEFFFVKKEKNIFFG